MANRLYGNGGGSHNSYASIDDEESADSERFQPMRSRLFTFEGLTGIQDNKQSDVNNNVQQFLVDLASGVASTFLQFVFAMTYAAGCFSGPRTNSLFGYGVMMTAISAVLTQVFYSWRSEISYLFVSPDGFYIPLINALGDSLSSIISDDQIFRNTFLFSIVLTTFTVGMAKFICGHFNFVQFTDYIPYPAICGLMAGIGINLVQVAFKISMLNNKLSYSIIPAIIFAVCNITAQKKQINTAKSFLFLLFLSFSSFYLIIYFMKIPFYELQRENWTFNSENILKFTWIYCINEYENIYNIDYKAILTILNQIFSIAIIMVLKISITIPAYEKALSCRFNKSLELKKYGIATILTSLFGGVGTSPSLSILTIIIEMGGGEHMPGIITPILFTILYFTKFSCISYIPKFIFIGLLLTSGYSMVITWLIFPLYYIPINESIILIIIILVYLFLGMLSAMSIGSMLSILLFAFKFHEISCIKFITNGNIFHSTEERSDIITKKLKLYRHRIQIIQLQGYLAFANSNQLLDVVIQILDINNNDLHDNDNNNDDDDSSDNNEIQHSTSTTSNASNTKNHTAMDDIKNIFTKAKNNIKETLSIYNNEYFKNIIKNNNLNSNNNSNFNLKSNNIITTALQNNLNNKIINSLIRQNSISHLHLNSNSNIYQIPSSSSPYFTATPATTTTTPNNNNNKSSTKSTTKSNKSNQPLLMEDLLPYALIIHMNDVIGCDASAMDTFNQIVIFCRIKKCRLIFCTLNENELILFEKFGILSPSLSSPSPTMLQQEQKQEQQQKHSHVFYEEDLDSALRNIENCLISHYKLMNKTPKHDNNNDNIIADGFLQCLQLIHKRYPNINIKPLEIFSKYIITIDFIPGQIINSNVNNNNNNNTSSTTSSNNKDKECSKEAEGMFFLENGTIQHLISLEYNEIDIGKDFGIEIETDPTVVNTIQQQQQYNRLHDNNNHNNNHGNNINHLSNKKRLSHLNLVSDSHTCSWGSKHGPGWIFEESTSTSTSTHFNFDREISTYCAHTSCRVHYISGTHLKQAYENNPQSANTLLQLQLAVTKQQLSIATEHLSNLSDVLHFRSSKKKNL